MVTVIIDLKRIIEVINNQIFLKMINKTVMFLHK